MWETFGGLFGVRGTIVRLISVPQTPKMVISPHNSGLHIDRGIPGCFRGSQGHRKIATRSIAHLHFASRGRMHCPSRPGGSLSVFGQAKRDQSGQVKGTHLVEKKESLFFLFGHALLESVALPIHDQNVSMMGEAIRDWEVSGNYEDSPLIEKTNSVLFRTARILHSLLLS
jgi:hypothetical protein